MHVSNKGNAARTQNVKKTVDIGNDSKYETLQPLSQCRIDIEVVTILAADSAPIALIGCRLQ